ncbi:substrate-binding periplasmic protein [Bacillus sp. UNC41MFS5]|uniref:substrate-binding periplasmic protein n=1 Tax=Bacillus sp. UNC41MFS5 TaxID=1449046 RepID=UPI0009DF4CCA|nr:ABC transporter substrate-binding protein [Bacillus sp. UNC41MFS5]
MKKFISMLAILSCLLLILSACSEKSNSSKEGANSLEALKEKGTVRVGGSTTGPPFSYINEKNENVGLMFDIAKKIGVGLGVKTEIQGMQFASLIPAIEAEKIDMISAGMIITDERKKIIDFSDPIYEYGEGLVILKSDNNIKTFDDLKGKKVGVQQGTIYLEGLKNFPDIEAQSYKSISDMVSELENGRIDAFFGDYPIIVHMIQENPDFKIKLVDGYEPKWKGKVGIGLPKGSDELMEAVNKEIKKLKESGEIDKILKKRGLK